MDCFTVKIEKDILNDKSYFGLSAEAKNVYLAVIILCNADGGGVSHDQLEHILRKPNAIAIRALREAGFVTVASDGMIYPTGKKMRKETKTKASQSRRARLASSAPALPPAANMVQNQPASNPIVHQPALVEPIAEPEFDPVAMPAPAYARPELPVDAFDDWDQVEEEPTPAPQRQPAPAPVVESEVELEVAEEVLPALPPARKAFSPSSMMSSPRQAPVPMDIGDELTAFVEMNTLPALELAPTSPAGSEIAVSSKAMTPKQAAALAKKDAAKLAKFEREMARQSGMKPWLLANGYPEILIDSHFRTRIAKNKEPLDQIEWAGYENAAIQANWTMLEAFTTMCIKKWVTLDASWLVGLTKPTAMSAPKPGQVAEGYYKDAEGHLKKRNGGVAL